MLKLKEKVSRERSVCHRLTSFATLRPGETKAEMSYDDVPCFPERSPHLTHTMTKCLDNCRAPEGFGLVQTGPQVCCWQRRPKSETWSVMVNAAPGSVQVERRSGRAGGHSCSFVLLFCVVGSHCDL